MKTWSFYDMNTGLFTGAYLGAVDRAVLNANTPDGCKAIEGQYDHLSQRVDLKTGAIIDWQPAPPDEDHEWSAKDRRWILKASAIARNEAKIRMLSLEAGQARAVRELMLNPLDETAKQRLMDIDREIAKNRQLIVQATEDRKIPIHKVTDAKLRYE